MHYYRSRDYRIAPQYSDPPDSDAGMEEAPETCGVCGVPTDELEDHADQGWRDVADGNIEPSDINQCDRCAVDWGR